VKIETWVFAAGAVFFLPIAIVYGIVTDWAEPVGPVGMFLTAGLAGMIALYLWLTSRRIDARPEDDPHGEIAQGAGELGHFAPHSWWPLATAIGASITFAGFAVGWWLVLIGIPIALLATVGWVFEFYRGEHAH
jgi:hypothetical protein